VLLTPRDERSPLAEGDPLPPEDRATLGLGPDLDRLYRSNRSRLLGFFRRAVSADAAADLCQQLFVRLAGRSSEQAIANSEAYLRRSATNLAADYIRSKQRRPRIEPLSADTCELTGLDPTAALEARDLLRRLEAAIAGLKPRTREIFLAHRFDGFSYREIAVRTGLSVKAVEKHMSRAIAQIDRLSR
jgi:RNA polymerase sigma-70 factor (ECF subfamily)